MNITPVILSGGAGTRLWPLSRKLFPKQFHALVGEYTLLQDTLLRLKGIGGVGTPIIVANDEHRFLVAEQLRELKLDANIVLEPIGRNTAPAATVAALSAKDPNDILVVLPADHVIRDLDRFHRALDIAVASASEGNLVTFGIVPDRAETGYGYLEVGDASSAGTFDLNRFIEKPPREKAEQFVATGRHLWNSGMFVFQAGTWLDAVREYAPQFLEPSTVALNNARRELNFVRLDKAAFARVPDDSIDYAVMEHVSNGTVVKLDAGWSDIGAWDALADCAPKDTDGNVTKGDVKTVNTRNSLIHATSRLVAAVGLEDCIIVETADAVLVTTRESAQDIKTMVGQLEEDDRSEPTSHRVVRRPWGTYDGVNQGDRYQVKHIVVKPGASLSLQMHHHRAEHWVVVRGTARVTRGDEVILLAENQSTYIPIGVIHRLENPGKIDLELIEVQSGSYLGEDDIARFDDRYGRTG